MAVGLLNGATDRCSDVGEEQRGADVAGQLAQILVVPGRFGAVKDTGRIGRAVPANTESVAVGGLGPEL
jgi:hypothetical protein